ncbi:hypothetical protein HYX12_00075 [Candidatus Woesearchaeota archaeon]|nr:hypothetical protein [Candidatus Woesearchaeota archaeon]
MLRRAHLISRFMLRFISRTKKGDMVLGWLGKVILAIAGFAVIATVFFIFLYPSLFGDKKDVELCRSSVILRTSTGMSFDNSETKTYWAPLLCPVIEPEIGGDREEIKEQMAQMMAKCWYMYNEARQDEVLEPAGVLRALGWEDNTNECALCYIPKITNKEIEGGSIEAPEMFQYLYKNDHYRIKGKTYLDYIQTYGGPGKVAIMDSIKPQQSYGVAFLSRNKDNSEFQTIDAAAIVVALAGAGVIACAILEPCGAIVAGVSTVVGAVGGTAAVITAKAGVIAATVAAAGYEGAHAVNAIKSKFYEADRDISMIVVDDINVLENNAHCDVLRDE